MLLVAMVVDVALHIEVGDQTFDNKKPRIRDKASTGLAPHHVPAAE
jgi:hypothetical protein